MSTRSNPPTQAEVHQLAKEKGFYDYTPVYHDAHVFRAVALIHAELSEFIEAMRRGDEQGAQMELADVYLRLLDLSEFFGGDIQENAAIKHEFNKKRPYKHGKAF